MRLIGELSRTEAADNHKRLIRALVRETSRPPTIGIIIAALLVAALLDAFVGAI